nr:hypothetical protein [Tanacetum cinerariifolium]
EAVHKELGDSLVRAATTVSSLGAECQEAMRDTTAQTRFKSVSKLFNDSLLAREKTKTSQHNEIISLKRRVKKLKKRNRSRTHKLKRLYKVGLTASVESSNDEESLGEDASKQERIEAIDADEDITLEQKEPSKSTTTATISKQQSHDKDKAIMIEEPVKPKRKD